MSKIVIVRNVSNLSEARYCAGMGVNYIGFELNPNSPYFIEEKLRQDIINWTSGVDIIYSFSGGNATEFKEALAGLEFSSLIISSDQESILEDKNLSILFLTDKTKEINFTGDLFYFSEEPTYENELAAYDFDSPLRFPHATGYVFMGTLETRPGFVENDSLMEALEAIEEMKL